MSKAGDLNFALSYPAKLTALPCWTGYVVPFTSDCQICLNIDSVTDSLIIYQWILN